MVKFFFSCWLMLMMASLVEAQPRFRAGAVAGLNFTQLDGDDAVGYDKRGMMLGLRATARVIPSIQLSTEILFSQKGAIFNNFRNSVAPKQEIHLNYMEIPVMVNFMLRRVEREMKKDYFHRYEIGLGVAFARLIQTEITEDNGDDIDFTKAAPFFQDDDFSVMMGGQVNITKQLGIGFLYSISTSLIYDRTLYPDLNSNVRLLRNYYVAGRVVYML